MSLHIDQILTFLKPDSQVLESPFKLGHLYRYGRKKQGLTQAELAQQLKISQGTLSKLEGGQLGTELSLWHRFCLLTQVVEESYRTGYNDPATPLTVTYSSKEGLLQLPSHFSFARGLSVRMLMPFLKLLHHFVSDKGLERFLRLTFIDFEFFSSYSEQLNYNFLKEICNHLRSLKQFKKENLALLVHPLTQSHYHGKVYEKLKRTKNQFQLINTLIRNMPLYEIDFLYDVEERAKNFIDLGITPNQHMSEFHYQPDEWKGFLCEYKKAFFRRVSMINGNEPISIEELQCHFKGADRCVYKFNFN